MVKTLTCAHGHHWQIADDAVAGSELHKLSCPVCGASAETVTDATSFHDTNKDSHPPQGTANDPNRLTGYEILDEAGRGGMGVVYRALDKQHGRTVALKTLQRIDPVALQRFKKEFRSLSDVSHSNLVSLYELISDGENWCLTMELIDGVDLLKFIRFGPTGKNVLEAAVGDATIELDSAALRAAGQPGLSSVQLDRLRRVVGQLATGIAALHAHGILHRDIKPSNVLVTKEGRAVLLDFGLAAALDSSQEHRNSQDSLLGTVAYMSPEQAASDSVSPATDWYALGSILYEALTGQTPYTGKPLQILQAKQGEDPRPPSESWPDVPGDLEQLCMQLLNRDPAERAAEGEVLRVFEQDDSGVATLQAPLEETTSLIGREQHLAALRDAFSNVTEGRGANVFAWGASGNGKTALVQSFIDEICGNDDVVVLSGRCYERESVPFKAIDSLIDSLVAHLKQLSRGEAEALMPRDVQSLIRLFPVVGQIEAAAGLPHRKMDVFDQQELNRRAIAALRELLARMGDRCRLVVYIDDLQWGDEDSAAMVSDLLQPPDPPVLMFLGTYRSEDAETSPFLNAFRQLQLQRESPLETIQVEVKPLDSSDAVKLALALLQKDDADAHGSAEAIARESEGNPFYISELVKQLSLGGDLASTSATEPLVLADMIWSRVQRLADESQRLLEVVALAGQPLPLDQALRIADVGHSAVAPLRAGHLIRTVGSSSSSRIETYHDRVRESVGTRLDPERSQHQHRRIAEDYAMRCPHSAVEAIVKLERSFTDDSIVMTEFEIDGSWYDIAFHFDAAELSHLAFPYALATAEKARLQFSLEVSERQYRIAERDASRHRDPLKGRVAEGLGDVLMLRGKYPEAAEQFETARKLNTETDAQARIEGKIGELAFKCGDNKTAAEALERSLRLLGRRIPPGSVMFLPFLVWETLVQTLHTLLPSWFLERRKLKGTEKEFLSIRLYTRLAYAYFFDRGKVPCLWTHMRAINLAERYPPTLELGHAWATHAPVMSLIPWLARGEDFAKRSLRVREELGDVWGQGQSLHYWGIVLFVGARFDECIDKCREAVRLLERTGDYWEVNVARYAIANSMYRKGDLSQAIAEATRLYEAAREMGDDKVSGFILDVWSRASGGQLPAEIVHREMEKERNDVQATSQVLLAEAVRLIGNGELAEAAEILIRAHRVCSEVGMQNAWVSPIQPWLATVRRLQLGRETDELSRRQLHKQARRAARQGLAMARKFKTDLPHALRETALLAAIDGDANKARKLLDESLAVAESQGARFEHAQALFARGRLGQQHGWQQSEQDLATARQSLQDLGAEFALDDAELSGDL